jgi:hypothetical protein
MRERLSVIMLRGLVRGRRVNCFRKVRELVGNDFLFWKRNSIDYLRSVKGEIRRFIFALLLGKIKI